MLLPLVLVYFNHKLKFTLLIVNLLYFSIIVYVIAIVSILSIKKYHK